MEHPHNMPLNPTDSARIGHIETQVSNVATSLDAFIKETAEFRVRTERESSQIWAAIREQGDNLRNAVEKLSARGQLSWTAIVATGGLIIGIIGMAAAVNNALIQGQLKQLEIKDTDQATMMTMMRDYEDKLRDADTKIRETHDKYILRICDEDHEAIRRLSEK